MKGLRLFNFYAKLTDGGTYSHVGSVKARSPRAAFLQSELGVDDIILDTDDDAYYIIKENTIEELDKNTKHLKDLR